MKKQTYHFSSTVIVTSFIAIGAILGYLASCGLHSTPPQPEFEFEFTELTDDGFVPPWSPAALCDTVTGIKLSGPEQSFAGVIDGYIYSNGQILDHWVDSMNPYETLAALIPTATACEQTIDQMGITTISGYIDVPELPSEYYWIMVEVSGHPQPYGLLVWE